MIFVKIIKGENIMIKGIEFNGEEWEKEKDHNFLGVLEIKDENIGLTNNVVVLCENRDIKYKISKTINDILNHKFDDSNEVDFVCEDEDYNILYKDRCFIEFGLTTIFNLYNQRITLSIEPSVIYKATKLEDIWLAETDIDERFYSVFPILDFESSDKVFNKGLDEVYKMIVSGRYGCYDGSWIKEII